MMERYLKLLHRVDPRDDIDNDDYPYLIAEAREPNAAPDKTPATPPKQFIAFTTLAATA